MSITPLTSLLGIPVFLPQDRQEETDFARLSPEAQELIVNAVIGMYDNKPPENIPEAVRDEIAKWAAPTPEEAADMHPADPVSLHKQQEVASELHRAQRELAATLVGKSLKECREAGLLVPEWDDDLVFKSVADNTLVFTAYQPAPVQLVRMSGTLSLNTTGEPVLDGKIETVQDGH